MDNNIQKITNLLFEVGTLRKVARSHRQTLLTNDLTDNIATHSYRVAFIGYILAKMERADSNKVLAMCLLHDLPEARSGDQNWVHKKYVKVFEEEIIKEQLGQLNETKELFEFAKEYNKRESKEAKLAKDADLIDQIILLREYEWIGNQEAAIWLKGQERYKKIWSKSGKKIAKEIIKTKPSSWWNKFWTAERR
ncbi:HD domain-containing protein [Candidatus Woesebacteria bacterium]|nr:HD domain-containing protein [Candidatus Woesebacteria bacterium]